MESSKKRKAQSPAAADSEPENPLASYSSSSFNCLVDGFNMVGKVALVTGGRGWLGTAICEALAEAGCSVVVASRELDKAQEAAERLPRLPGDSDPKQRHAGVRLDPAFVEFVELASVRRLRVCVLSRGLKPLIRCLLRAEGIGHVEVRGHDTTEYP